MREVLSVEINGVGTAQPIDAAPQGPAGNVQSARLAKISYELNARWSSVTQTASEEHTETVTNVLEIANEIYADEQIMDARNPALLP